MNFLDSRVQVEVQNQKPEDPHKIKENEETSFVVQTQGVQIAKDVSHGGELGIRTLGTSLYTAFRVLHLRPLGQLSVYSRPPAIGRAGNEKILSNETVFVKRNCKHCLTAT